MQSSKTQGKLQITKGQFKHMIGSPKDNHHATSKS